MSGCVLGIFVGGKASRMNHFPKGLLQCPDGSGQTIIEHWQSMALSLDLDCVLVGANAAYPRSTLLTLDDRPAGIGPLGGLTAFLAHCHAEDAAGIAVACDMPYVGLELLSRLCRTDSKRPILAPRRTDTLVWEPLFAKYDAAKTLALIESLCCTKSRSLQVLLDTAQAEVLPMHDHEWLQLNDWDYPTDI